MVWPVAKPLLREHEVKLSRTHTALDGVRIAHLSDIHCGGFTPEAQVRHAVELTNRLAPDLTVMTGDYVNWKRREIDIMRAWLSGLQAPVFACLGNHDYFTSASGVSSALQKHGYDVLRNQHTTLMLRGEAIHIIGIDDPITRHDDIDRAFSGVPNHGFRITLCHYPERAQRIAAKGSDLVLCGHTHGAQIYVPRITDRVFARAGWRYRYGLHPLDTGRLYVTSGIGFSGIPVRYGHGTAAEVAVFTLRSE